MTVIKFKKPNTHSLEVSYIGYVMTCGACNHTFEQLTGNILFKDTARIREGDKVTCPKCKTELKMEICDAIKAF